ncbi:MAG: DUF4358 domain-containing protein [Clostridia bacterium]|nr:DUF4358 domain-containing protein [Clostridia bacterium]
MKSVIYEIIRIACVVLLAALIVSGSMKNKVSSAEIEDVFEEVKAKISMDNMLEGDNQMIKRLYGLNPEDYEGCVLYYPETNMDAQELFIVKLADVSQQKDVEAAVEKRIETQKKTFDGYGIEQYALLTDNSVVEVRGNYILFIVNQNSESAKSAFSDAL